MSRTRDGHGDLSSKVFTTARGRSSAGCPSRRSSDASTAEAPQLGARFQVPQDPRADLLDFMKKNNITSDLLKVEKPKCDG